MNIGILSDTHNQLPDRAGELLHGVDHILHAGDVCQPTIIAELEAIAPVTVARGNNDDHPGWRETECVELGGRRFLVRHILTPERPSREFREFLQRSRPEVVVFGHTHRPFRRHIEGVLYLNPGSAGAPRFGLPRSLCLLRIRDGGMHPEFHSLDDRPLPPVA